MKVKGSKALGEFYVFEGVRDNFLSFKTCRDFELIQLTYCIADEDSMLKQNLKSHNPSCFSCLR